MQEQFGYDPRQDDKNKSGQIFAIPQAPGVQGAPETTAEEVDGVVYVKTPTGEDGGAF